MAHLRRRYIESMIEKAKKLSPLIGVLGHRQVGKTTVSELVCKGYVSLDDKESMKLAIDDSDSFLKKFSHFIQAIDECQYAPSLFPALKEHVRKHKQPGQYLLTGSVRFTSRSLIKESLTGRIVNFELLPLTVSELAHLPLPQNLLIFFQKTTADQIVRSIESKRSQITKDSKEFKYYFENGGLPGICFVNNKALRELKLREQIATLLERDLRLVQPTILSNSQIYDFLQYVAQTQGEVFNYSEAQRDTGISTPTQKKLLNSLEAIFLIRRLKVEGSYKGEIFYLEDQAESVQMSQNTLSENQYFQQFVYRNLRAQFYYQLGCVFREFVYITRGGVYIPYAIESNGFNLAVLPIADVEPNRSEMAAAGSFLKVYTNSRVLFLHRGNKIRKIDEKTISAPVYWFV